MANGNLQRFGVSNAVLPPEGPKAYPIELDFHDKDTHEIALGNEIVAERISYINGIYFDNRANANDVEVLVGGIQQRLRLPAGKCGYMPILFTDAASATFNSPIGDYTVQVIVLNTPVWPCLF